MSAVIDELESGDDMKTETFLSLTQKSLRHDPNAELFLLSYKSTQSPGRSRTSSPIKMDPKKGKQKGQTLNPTTQTTKNNKKDKH